MCIRDRFLVFVRTHQHFWHSSCIQFTIAQSVSHNSEQCCLLNFWKFYGKITNHKVTIFSHFHICMLSPDATPATSLFIVNIWMVFPKLMTTMLTAVAPNVSAALCPLAFTNLIWLDFTTGRIVYFHIHYNLLSCKDRQQYDSYTHNVPFEAIVHA